MTRKVLAVAGVTALALAMLAAPASATPKSDAGEHKITICHVTNSQTNPYVIIEVDVAAFDGEGKNDHKHHVNKDGMVDVPFVDGECQVEDTDEPDDPGGETNF